MTEAAKILQNIITFLFQVGTFGAAIVLIILGLRYAWEAKAGKTEQLKQLLIYVILGLILLLIAAFVPQLFKSFLQKYTSQ